MTAINSKLNTGPTTISYCTFTVDRTANAEVLKVLLEVAKGYKQILDVLEANIEHKGPMLQIG